MSANKAKNTTPELTLRKLFWKSQIRGYRIHNKQIPGRPDIAFTRHKVAIFVNGCFWHNCPYCHHQLPKSHVEFWKAKFEANQKRDTEKIHLLELSGWKVLTIWECQLKNNSTYWIEKTKEVLSS